MPTSSREDFVNGLINLRQLSTILKYRRCYFLAYPVYTHTH